MCGVDMVVLYSTRTRGLRFTDQNWAFDLMAAAVQAARQSTGDLIAWSSPFRYMPFLDSVSYAFPRFTARHRVDSSMGLVRGENPRNITRNLRLELTALVKTTRPD